MNTIAPKPRRYSMRKYDPTLQPQPVRFETINLDKPVPVLAEHRARQLDLAISHGLLDAAFDIPESMVIGSPEHVAAINEQLEWFSMNADG